MLVHARGEGIVSYYADSVAPRLQVLTASCSIRAMRTGVLGFALGVLLLQWLPSLPSRAQLLLLGVIALGMALVLYSTTQHRSVLWRRGLLLLFMLAVGLQWAAWRANWRLSESLPETLVGKNLELVGVVQGLPQQRGRAIRFVFEVESLQHQNEAEPLPTDFPRRVLLSWYTSPKREEMSGAEMPLRLYPGERWRLSVRLKPAHGSVNPHGFDYEAWLLERNIRATGYVRNGKTAAPPQRLTVFVPGVKNWLDRKRDSIRQRFKHSLTVDGRQLPYAGVLVALAVGDQQGIIPAQWEVFRRTAIAHLVSISGLHVSLVALFAGGLVAWLWRRSSTLMLRLSVRQAAAAGGLMAAIWYALLAGMGIATQRALIMLVIASLALLLQREVSVSRVWLLALGVVLLFDPWSVLSAGFWLSFGCIGVILFVLTGRRQPGRGWQSAIRMQMAITLVSMPLLLCLFGAFSLVSPLANAIAIPVVSFAVTPLVLLGILFPVDALLVLAHWLTAWLMWAMEALSAWPLALWSRPAAPLTLVLMALLGSLWSLLPRGTPARAVGLLAIVPLLSWSPARPPEQGFRVTTLDIGQGTAVHVQTAHHDLLYDTGPAYGPHSDAGQRVLLPYLRAIGVTQIDRMLLSHGDLDHVGGAASVLDGMMVVSVWANLPPWHAVARRIVRAGLRRLPCSKGGQWTWDGVHFEILYPPDGKRRERQENENSCVVRISTQTGSVLLTGDIGKKSEQRLVAQYDSKLRSEILLAPHHGSRYSSSPTFVEAVAARHVLYSSGFHNAFKHPNPEVERRWEAIGARAWRTDQQGALIVEMDRRLPPRVQSQRALRPRYWYGR